MKRMKDVGREAARSRDSLASQVRASRPEAVRMSTQPEATARTLVLQRCSER